MAIRSVYVPDPDRLVEDGVLSVDGEEHQHLRVSRIRAGEEVEVLDGEGRVWNGIVVDIRRDSTRVRLGNLRVVRPSGTHIILAQALVRNSAFDWILEKAVELGVSRIVPFRAERSNETGRGRERRWQRIVVEATKQSKQYHVPKLEPVRDFGEVLAIDANTRLVLCERGTGDLRSALSGPPVLCLIGPEGGWAGSETDRLKSAGFREVHFGHQILRAETAAILAVGLIAYELGAY